MILQNRMENKLKFLLLLLVCLFAVSAFSACGQGQNNAGSLNYPVLQLNVGESKELELTENDIIILQGVEWSSDDESVATVKNGLVTAVGAGSATINASYNGRIYACIVTVKAVSVTALSNTELFLIIGKEKTLSLLKDGEQIRDGIEWSSSDEEVAIADNGNVLCLSAGECRITAKYEGEKYICELTVYPAPYGAYYSRVKVEEMDGSVFEFVLTLSENGTYKYSRRDSGSESDGNFIAGEEVNEGTWAFRDGGIIVFTFNGGEMEMQYSSDGKLTSVGQLPTGGMDSELNRPSETRIDKFNDREELLRKNLPPEMLTRPNWVIVRTRQNEEKGRPDKFLISPVTGKFAEIDNPETWTDFDTACKYAHENGGVSLAYALDGKDNICCIDLDHCFNGNRQLSDTAKEAWQACGDTYREISVSRNGLHIFGKTDGMDVRSFSKDGKLEFYQKSHFITVTGDRAGNSSSLANFDSLPIKGHLEEVCGKHAEWKGAGQGVEGLSSMSDRDVVEKACSAKNGATFKAYYEGQDLKHNHSNSDMALMTYLAFWCNGDVDQMLRINATSGLYRPEKSPEYYEHTAMKAVRENAERFQPKREQKSYKPRSANGADKGGK